MPLAQEITAISLDVIREHAATLELVSPVASDGGSERVEIMVTAKGNHAELCRLVLNPSRADRETLEADLRQTLHALHPRTDTPGRATSTKKHRSPDRPKFGDGDA
jgi:hypothetical protein